MRRDGRGSLTPLIAVIVLTAGGSALLIGRLGGAAVARAQARTAADAAALAGAAEGRPAAEMVAVANGGRLGEFPASGLPAAGVVVVGPPRARAPAGPAPPATSSRPAPSPTSS